MLKNAFNLLKNFMFTHYAQKEGTMLIHLGALGWLLSSLAQTIAIVTNKKITSKDKKFLVPQELADGAINVACYYGITKMLQKTVATMIDTGKISFKNSAGVLENSAKFKSPLCVAAVIVGSVISCNFVTPVLRNLLASFYQNKKLQNYPNNHPLVKYYNLYQPYSNSVNIRSLYSKGMKI